MSKLKLTFKVLIFISVFSILFSFISNVLIKSNDAYTRRQSFELLQENSIDIMFIGNSHAFCSFISEDIEAITGKRVYNAAMPSQVIDLAWYNLEIFLKTQSPKVIVLEAFAFQDPSARDVFNDSNIDSMKMGKTKLEAIFEIFGSFKDRSQLFFKMYRNHSNWTDPVSIKYNALNMSGRLTREGELFKNKGYYKLESKMSEETAGNFKNMNQNEAKYKAKVNQYNIDYFNKIVNICAEKEIKLVVTMSPQNKYFIQKVNYNKVYSDFKSLCDSKNIEYIDYNMLYNDIKLADIDFADEFHDAQHTNFYGAQKISKHIANYLANLKY